MRGETGTEAPRWERIEARTHPLKMALPCLQTEFSENWRELIEGSPGADPADALHGRNQLIFNVLEQRMGVSYPKCPSCHVANWAQAPGEPLLCGDCLESPPEEIREQVHQAWDRLAGGGV